MAERSITLIGEAMFKYFVHYSKETGEIVGWDKAPDVLSVDVFENEKRRSEEVTKEQLEELTDAKID